MIITTNEKKRKAHQIVHRVLKFQEHIQSLIKTKTDNDDGYDISKDNEISYLIDYLKVYNVEKSDTLSARPLSLSFRKYDTPFYLKNLKPKSFEEVRQDYSVGAAASES